MMDVDGESAVRALRQGDFVSEPDLVETIIVGGSLAGLTTAIALAARGGR